MLQLREVTGPTLLTMLPSVGDGSGMAGDRWGRAELDALVGRREFEEDREPEPEPARSEPEEEPSLV